MIVCVCRRISDRQIRQAAAQGAHSLDCLKAEFGVAMVCGRCAECACSVLAEASRSRPAASAASAFGGLSALDCVMPRAATA